jgi:hypothetical protein
VAVVIWRLEIAEWSSSTVLDRVTVEASNWMNALRLGRKSLGDRAEVPPGASCAILPSGIVTVLDPASRRKFTLSQATETEVQKARADVSSRINNNPVQSAGTSESIPVNKAAPQNVGSSLKAPIRTTSERPPMGPAELREELLRKEALRKGKKRQSVDNQPARHATVSTRPISVIKAPESKSITQDTASFATHSDATGKIKSLAIGRQPREASAEAEKGSERVGSVIARPAGNEDGGGVPNAESTATIPLGHPSESTGPVSGEFVNSADNLSQERISTASMEVQEFQALQSGTQTPTPDGSQPTSDMAERVVSDETHQKNKRLMQPSATYPFDTHAVAPSIETMVSDAGQQNATSTPETVSNPPTMEASLIRMESNSDPIMDTSSPESNLDINIRAQSAALGSSALVVESTNEQPPPEMTSEIKVPSVEKSHLELLVQRNEEPSDQNPLTYRERIYVCDKALLREEVVTALREKIAIIQEELKAAPKGKFINLAAFDYRWDDQPDRPPIVVIQWKDWRGELEIEFPEIAAPAVSQVPAATTDRTSRLEDAFEALHELQFLSTPAEGLAFVINILQETIPSEAASACLYDINSHEMRFVVVTGPGAEQRKGEAVPLTLGLFGQAAKNYESPTVVSNVSASPYFDPQVDSRPNLMASNILYRPITFNQRLLGMLQLINRQDQSQFSSLDVNLINYVASQLAEFVHEMQMKTATLKQ